MRINRAHILEFLKSGKAFAWMLAIVALAIPVVKSGIQIPLFLLIISWFFVSKTTFKANAKEVLLFSGIYIFHIIAMFYTADISEGFVDLESKLSILLFPILLGAVKPISTLSYQRVLKFFVFGTVVAVSIGYISSIIDYRETEDLRAFYMSNFSPVHHPSYVAMYINLAIFILAIKACNRALARKPDVWHWILMLLLALTLVFLASKLGVLSFVFSIPCILIVAWRKGILKSVFTLKLLAVLGVFVLFFLNDPISSKRLANSVKVATEEQVDKQGSEMESTRARKTSWTIAVAEIAKHPFGVGTGDIQNHMDTKYRENGHQLMAEHSLNVHNAFLQMALAQGWLALLWFLFSLAYPLRMIWKNSWWIYGFFLVLISVNFLVESMLEKQSGVIFFAFFNAVFFFTMKGHSPRARSVNAKLG